MEVKNENGDILIDGENKHPFLHEIVNLNVSSLGTKTVSFTPTIEYPLLTLFIDSAFVVIMGVYKNSSNEFYQVEYRVTKTGNNAEILIYTL